jgi:hypothetical protein
MTFARDLDQMLRSDGQQVTLRRMVGTTNRVPVDCTCWASVRGYQPQELAGAVIQGDSHVVLSGTDIIAAQWPGGEPITSPPTALDPRVPRTGDFLVIEGRTRAIVSAAPIYVGDDLVRVDIQARG